MARQTSTEKRLAERKRAAATGAVLVPILEQLLEHECIPEDEQDFAFLDFLLRARAQPRASGVFSPSMLGSCVRQAWFAKRNEPKEKYVFSTRANGFFLTGNFTHFKWQFACWKAERAGLLKIVRIANRPAVELRVHDGDMAGTVDVIVEIDKHVYPVDFKGINLYDFQKTIRHGAPQSYRKQIVGYALLLSSALQLELEDCLLVSECKAGPLSGSGSPLGLHETRISVEAHRAEVTRRLKTLSYYDARNRRPEPECTSTQEMAFQQCPFAGHCLEEVALVQRERERRAQEQKRSWKVARPPR